jgi:hypothetical protein
MPTARNEPETPHCVERTRRGAGYRSRVCLIFRLVRRVDGHEIVVDRVEPAELGLHHVLGDYLHVAALGSIEAEKSGSSSLHLAESVAGGDGRHVVLHRFPLPGDYSAVVVNEVVATHDSEQDSLPTVEFRQLHPSRLRDVLHGHAGPRSVGGSVSTAGFGVAQLLCDLTPSEASRP